nr:hypothetical protein [Tanacetum cinerariifolium]
MDASPSPNHMIDFPTNEPSLELEDPVMEFKEDPMKDQDMDIDKNREDEGASSALPEAPYLMGRPLPVVAARVALHHEEIRAEQGKLVAGKLDETETQGVVGLRHWFEKVEQLFKISKCTEEDKVKFVACTFEGRALSWWNGNVHTLRLVNANNIPWNEFKAMMTNEYTNRFHELSLMCPELVTSEKKKIKHYIRGLNKRIKANVTSSKPTNLYTAINMARELVEQAIQAKSTRIRESNKRRRQEGAKAYTTALAERKGYLRTRPICNQCNLHHDELVPELWVFDKLDFTVRLLNEKLLPDPALLCGF